MHFPLSGQFFAAGIRAKRVEGGTRLTVVGEAAPAILVLGGSAKRSGQNPSRPTLSE